MTASKEYCCTWQDVFWKFPNLLSKDKVSIETWNFKIEIQYNFIFLNT